MSIESITRIYAECDHYLCHNAYGDAAEYFEGNEHELEEDMETDGWTVGNGSHYCPRHAEGNK